MLGMQQMTEWFLTAVAIQPTVAKPTKLVVDADELLETTLLPADGTLLVDFHCRCEALIAESVPATRYERFIQLNPTQKTRTLRAQNNSTTKHLVTCKHRTGCD